jgi:hypothetical protein
MGGQLGAVVAADEARGPAALGDQAVQDSDGGVGVDPPVNLDGQGLAGVLVHDVEQLEGPCLGGLVELVVQRPHMVRVLGGQPIRRVGGGAEALALAPLGGTRRPSSRHRRWTALRLIIQPCPTSWAWARR